MQKTKSKVFWMRESELEQTLDWARLEGWNPGLNDAKLFYKADPNGFFGVLIDDEIIAMGSAVRYDSCFAFCGLYIVRPQYRGNGYGMALTKERLRQCGTRNIGIDGVLENVHLYEKIGYKKYYNNIRYQFEAIDIGLPYKKICPIHDIHFRYINKYDRQCFPACRSDFLYSWVNDSNAVSYACIENNQVRGYIVRRKCHDGYRIGPLFADNSIIAECLLLACQQNIKGESIFIDIPDINRETKSLVSNFKMKQVFATSRMYTKELPNLNYYKMFGVSTLELG